MQKYLTITEYAEYRQITKQAVSQQIKSNKVESVILDFKGSQRRFVIVETEKEMTTVYDKYMSNLSKLDNLPDENDNDKQEIMPIKPTEILASVRVYESQLKEKDRQIAEKDAQIAKLLETQTEQTRIIASLTEQTAEKQQAGTPLSLSDRIRILFTGKV